MVRLYSLELLERVKNILPSCKGSTANEELNSNTITVSRSV